MLTKGGVKLLDFGLARLHGSGEAAAGADLSGVTDERTIAGTLPYMSPEQLRGERGDARSDIFAFGAVLYEMFTAKPAFAADSRAELIAAILEREPPSLSDVHPPVPPAVDRLVRTCLAKDPAERWQHAHDVVLALKGIHELDDAPPPGRPARALRVATMVASALALVTSVALGYVLLARAPAPSPPDVIPRRAMLDLAPVQADGAWSPAFSPNGRTVAFLGAGGGQVSNFFIHSLDSGETRQLTHTVEVGCGWAASWSSDGRRFFYLLSGRLRAVDPATGSDRVVTESMSQAAALDGGVAESPDGTLLVGGSRLQRLSPGQQIFQDVATPHPSVTLQVWPSFLPGGREFLFAQSAADPSHQGVFMGSLDTDRVVRLLPAFSNAALAATGHLVYGKEGSILAQPFDQKGRRVTGDAIVLISGVSTVNRYTHFALASGKTLVYVPGEDTAPSELVWYNRTGRAVGKLGTPYTYRQISMSPDGRRVLVERSGYSMAPGSRFWVMDVARGTMQSVNLTITDGEDLGSLDPGDGVWSPDGRQIAMSAGIDHEVDLFVIGLNPSDRLRRLRKLPGNQWAEHWSRDGQLFLYGQADSASKESIWALPLDGDRPPFVVVDSPSFNDEAQLSPDGRWLAYTSNDSGRFEVFVQPFTRPGERVQLSTEGGGQPKWRADGRELFFMTHDGTMMTVAMPEAGEPGTARPLFRSGIKPMAYLDQYAVTLDGQKFLVITPAVTDRTARMTVISDWPGLLKK